MSATTTARGLDVTIVRTGAANLASLRAAFARLGVGAHPSDDPAEVRRAAGVVLPGVGSFAPARARLARLGLDGAIRERIDCGAPLLAICLGFQLLTEGSAEAPCVAGLGVVPGSLERLRAEAGQRVPHLGWTPVETAGGAGLLRDGWAAFAHSYALRAAPRGWRAALAEHGGPFVAAIERDGVLACQFHPELSGAWGLELLRGWLTACVGQEVPA